MPLRSMWLYPYKTTTISETISKLCLQRYIFGNLITIISDKGSTFTSTEFQQYCQNVGTEHMRIMVGLPHANSQVKRLKSTDISVTSNLSQDAPDKWLKHFPKVKEVINSTNGALKKNTFQQIACKHKNASKRFQHC